MPEPAVVTPGGDRLTASPLAQARRQLARAMHAWPGLIAAVMALLVGAVVMLLAGADPVAAYRAMVEGALGPANRGRTLELTAAVLGLGLCAGIPLRAGFINLGGEGQMVAGGIAAAVVAIHVSLPGPLVVVLAVLAGCAAGAAYAWLAALAEFRLGVPLLVSSLLLGFAGKDVGAYLLRYTVGDESSGLAQTPLVPEAARLPAVAFNGVFTLGAVLVFLAAVAWGVWAARTVGGYELRMAGLARPFAAQGGVPVVRHGTRAMLAGGACAGLVAGMIVLGEQFRMIDGALVSVPYTWMGFMAALLARGRAAQLVAASAFFAILHVGGLAMQGTTGISADLADVLQALVIVFVAAQLGRAALNGRGAAA